MGLTAAQNTRDKNEKTKPGPRRCRDGGEERREVVAHKSSHLFLAVSVEPLPRRSQLGESREKQPHQNDVPHPPERSHSDTKTKSRQCFIHQRGQSASRVVCQGGRNAQRSLKHRLIQRWTTSWKQNVNEGTHRLAMGTNGESIADGQDLSGDH